MADEIEKDETVIDELEAEDYHPHDAVEDVEISTEMREAFLDYSMSVIVQRALPDVRDGLKPVHRRILYAMSTLGMTSNQAHKKSARIVGDVIGKYHPHGDTAVYDAMVRMAQDFSYRYPLIDGHGNFGSMDGDGAAAMRYTEARMSKISNEMVADLNKETVDFTETYDADGVEPTVLPSRIPNLLLNGAMGIAVGMATNIPPHNIRETVAAIDAVMENRDITIPELMEHIKGPDFPTGGIILGRKGIRQAYETGRGSITVRSKYRIEELSGGRKRVIFYEIPYGINKANMFEKMASLIRDKVIQGVTYLNDESNREGIRIVMELKKDAQEDVIINQLFRLTPLQSTYGINMLALENGRPKQLTLKEIIVDYVDHQINVIRRKTAFDLKKALERAHILEGLRIALAHLDDVIAMIRQSRKEEAGLIADMNETFGLDDIQSKAILAMQIRRLSGLEQEKIENEYQNLLKTIADLRDILARQERVLQIIKDDLQEMLRRYGDERRTEILDSFNEMDDEDLIPVENSLIMLTDSGYIKRQPVDTFSAQHRGGKGIRGLALNEEDSLSNMISMSTHDHLLLFTNLGRVYRLKGYNVPAGSRTSKGIPVVNLMSLAEGEQVKTLLPISADEENKYLFFITRQGVVKRTSIEEFEQINKNGKIAIQLREDDELAFVTSVADDDEILIGGSNGKAVRFKTEDVRAMGRSAAGVNGFNTDGGTVVGYALRSESEEVLTVSENGYGKRSKFEEFRLTNRGVRGTIAQKITDRTGAMMALKGAVPGEDALIVSSDGIMIRTPLDSISSLGRAAQGVKLISLNEGQHVQRITLAEPNEETVEEVQLLDEDGKPVETLTLEASPDQPDQLVIESEAKAEAV